MEHEPSIPEYGALMVADIGVDQTHVALIDLVDQTYRLVAQASAPSSWAPPTSDPMVAIHAALRQIESTTGRQLLQDGRLIVPQNEAGDGVDALVATTDAAGALPIAVAGLAQHESVKYALHAARSTYTQLVDSIALEEGGHALGRHLPVLRAGRPAVILLAGGHEQGATSAGRRLARLLGLYAEYAEEAPLIVFAGNSAAAEAVRTQIGTAARLEQTDNLLPRPQQPRIEPTRALLRRLYREQVVAHLPGAERLTALGCRRLGSRAEDQGLITRFLGERYQRNVLTVDAGSQTTACLLMSEGHYSEAIFGRLGTRLGSLQVLREVGAEAITRWLPFALDARALETRLLNRALRPRQLPSDLDDLLLDAALLREAISLAYRALRDERPRAPIDLVIAAGLPAEVLRPGLAALVLLDALQPAGNDGDLAINLYLDQFGLLAAGGALAHIDADAAACVVEQDLLNNAPLATVIVPRGTITPGKQVAEVELQVLGGETLTQTVHGGAIVRLPLARGKRGTLRIRPAAGIAIGQNRAGYEVISDEAAIAGSTLGVIIDARPRPLTLPTEQEERRTWLLRWMQALDALPPLPVAPPPAGPASQPAPNGHPTPAPNEEDAPADGTAHDVESLREELLAEPPRKRGWFRRR